MICYTPFSPSSPRSWWARLCAQPVSLEKLKIFANMDTRNTDEKPRKRGFFIAYNIDVVGNASKTLLEAFLCVGAFLYL